MIERNKGFSHLSAGYLFPEVAKRRKAYQTAHPDAKIISLGIGNTTEPLTPHIAKAMVDYVSSLATKEGYSGYGDEQGLSELRKKIAGIILIELFINIAINLSNKKRLKPKSSLCFKWSGRRDSNSRQSAWKADTLPTELRPHI